MKSKVFFSVFIVMICIAFMPFAAHAFRPSARTIQSVPFDGGLSLLVAAGVGYAARKGYIKRKTNANPEK